MTGMMLQTAAITSSHGRSACFLYFIFMAGGINVIFPQVSLQDRVPLSKAANGQLISVWQRRGNVSSDTKSVGDVAPFHSLAERTPR